MSQDNEPRRLHAGAARIYRAFLVQVAAFGLAHIIAPTSAVQVAVVIVLWYAMWPLEETIDAVGQREHWLRNAKTWRLVIAIGLVTALGSGAYLYATERLGYGPATAAIAIGGLNMSVSALGEERLTLLGIRWRIYRMAALVGVLAAGMSAGFTDGLLGLASAAVSVLCLPRLVAMANRLAEIEFIDERGTKFSPIIGGTAVAYLLAAVLLNTGTVLVTEEWPLHGNPAWAALAALLVFVLTFRKSRAIEAAKDKLTVGARFARSAAMGAVLACVVVYIPGLMGAAHRPSALELVGMIIAIFAVRRATSPRWLRKYQAGKA